MMQEDGYNAVRSPSGRMPTIPVIFFYISTRRRITQLGKPPGSRVYIYYLLHIHDGLSTFLYPFILLIQTLYSKSIYISLERVVIFFSFYFVAHFSIHCLQLPTARLALNRVNQSVDQRKYCPEQPES